MQPCTMCVIEGTDMLLQCPHECVLAHIGTWPDTHAHTWPDGCRQGADRPHHELIAAAFGGHEAVVLLLLERKEHAPRADCKDARHFSTYKLAVMVSGQVSTNQY